MMFYNLRKSQSIRMRLGSPDPCEPFPERPQRMHAAWPCRRVRVFALHNYPLRPARAGLSFSCCCKLCCPKDRSGGRASQDCGVARLEHAAAAAAQPRLRYAGQTDVFSSSASQRIPVTAIRADYEFAKAFYTPTAPRPRLGILRRLERRCGGRHFFHSRCADRNGTRTRSTSNRKPSRQAEKEECVTHGCLLDIGGAPTGYASLPITGRRDVL